MKAEDTVMQDSELFSKMRDKFLGLDAEIDVDWDLIKITKEAQAEITWNIAYGLGRTEGSYTGEEEGKEAGMREVVKFAEFWGGYRLSENSKWHAKLKEWGLE